MTTASDNYLNDKDFLRIAMDADDTISLCEEISRRRGVELTLGQAARLLDEIELRCYDCLGELDPEAYCENCES